jgi:hypothetical protein
LYAMRTTQQPQNPTSAPVPPKLSICRHNIAAGRWLINQN